MNKKQILEKIGPTIKIGEIETIPLSQAVFILQKTLNEQKQKMIKRIEKIEKELDKLENKKADIEIIEFLEFLKKSLKELKK